MSETAELRCADSDHEEGSEYPDHPCWGWFEAHTYQSIFDDLFQDGTVKPNEIHWNAKLSEDYGGEYVIEVFDTDSQSWTEIDGPKDNFDYLDEKEVWTNDEDMIISGIRVIVVGDGYVDGSKIDIHHEDPGPQPEDDGWAPALKEWMNRLSFVLTGAVAAAAAYLSTSGDIKLTAIALVAGLVIGSIIQFVVSETLSVDTIYVTAGSLAVGIGLGIAAPQLPSLLPMLG